MAKRERPKREHLPTSAEIEAHTWAADNHDPSREPYASMSRDEIMALIDAAGEPRERCMLEEFLLDKMTSEELRNRNHVMRAAAFLMDEFASDGNAQALFLIALAAEVTMRIKREMPPIGPPEECN